MQDNLATFVQVIIPLHLNKQYTYRVAKEHEAFIKIGIRVAVQFGSKRIYTAIVTKILDTPPQGYEAKYLLNIVDTDPIVYQHNLQFWQWLSIYYMCSIGDVMHVALPGGLKLQSKTTIILAEDYQEIETPLDDKEYLIVEALQLKTELTIDDVTEILQLKTVFPILKSLNTKGFINFKENLEEKYTPKTINCVRLNAIYTNEKQQEALFKQLDKNEKQLNILLAYLHLANNAKHVSKQLLLQTANATSSPLNTLAKKQIFEIYSLQVDRIKLDETPLETFTLNDEQKEAYVKINQFFAEPKPVLLHGITGSGKTHIYVNLINDALQQGKQVLFLLPEIALTSQIINRIRKYFGDKCVAFHSKFNENERVEIWQKVLNQQYQIVIGARSSLFLPFKNLGLIIIDEEHESSYKQQDPAPRYHARDAAVYMAHQLNANCILGSATPSFETYYNAQHGKFGLVNLLSRFGETPLPKIVTADLAEETRTKLILGNYFTTTLFNAIENAIKLGEQVILFQNRRGYAPILECQTCQWVPQCKNCDISLTYHKTIDSLKCHYCGYLQKVPQNCHACASPLLNFKGFGTEKIEDELKILFPEARIARLDLDAARTKYGHEQIITDFENHRFDILVGTQMLSKGLDFEKVNTVGIISADQLLFFPDFRANERAFQLIQQVGGRAGRRDKQGTVIVQTSKPAHYVITAAIENNFKFLLEHELLEREKFNYPPFTRLIKITLKHKDYKHADTAAFWLANQIKTALPHNNVLGPESPFVSRIRNFYIKEILVKVNRDFVGLAKLKHFIYNKTQELQTIKDYKSTMVYADVDPV